MTIFTTIWRIAQIPAVHHILLGAAGGLLPAVKIDYEAFKNWQNVHQAAEYDWGVAAWRWFKGTVIGAVSGLALGSVIG